MFLGPQVPSSDVSRVPTPLPTPKLTPSASRTHSPSRSATRSVPAFPTASLEQEPSTAGSRPSAADSGVDQSTVVLKELPAAAAPVQPKLEPATALVADSMPEPAATVSRQLEQAAALVLANTTNMLTHAAAALVSSQMAAPAGVQPTAPAGVQPSTAAPVQESDLEKAVALVLAAAPHGARERRDEECSEESDTEEGELELRTTEEHLLRDLGLTMTLGQLYCHFVEHACISARVGTCVSTCVDACIGACVGVHVGTLISAHVIACVGVGMCVDACVGVGTCVDACVGVGTCVGVYRLRHAN